MSTAKVSVIICVSTKIVGCFCHVIHGKAYIGLRTTSRHHTVDKIGVHCKITPFSCI